MSDLSCSKLLVHCTWSFRDLKCLHEAETKGFIVCRHYEIGVFASGTEGLYD